MREIATKKKPVFVQANSNSGQGHVLHCLGCQHFISDWLRKLKPNKLSTGCQNELKGAAVEKAMNPGRRFLFFSRLRRSFSRASRANFAATPLLRPARQNRHATQAREHVIPEERSAPFHRKRLNSTGAHAMSVPMARSLSRRKSRKY